MLVVSGIIPPIITPPANDDVLDVAGLERLVEHLIGNGVAGVFVLGTTGEGPSLSYRLRREMVQTTAKILNDRVPLYVGITDTSLVEAVNLGKFSADIGAAAVVAAPPFYFPAGQTELQHWFRRLAQSLPLPLLLYNIPACTKIAIEAETLTALISIENIIGLKDSSGNLDYLQQAIDLASKHREGWPVLVGPEHLLAQAVSRGAAGGVAGGANLVPRLFVEVFKAASSGNAESLQKLQTQVQQLQQLYSIGKYGSAFLKSVKCALELSGICSGKLAPPFDAFLLPERQRVTEWMACFASTGWLPNAV